VAVLTLERPMDEPFTLDEVEALRLTTDLCTPRIVERRRSDRWVGAKAARAARRGLAAVLGPRHTWAKLLVLLAAGLLAFMLFAQGDYNAEGNFELKPNEHRVLSAPHRGKLLPVEEDIRPGRVVKAGEVLARMDTSQLRLQRNKAEQAARQARIKIAAAMDQGKTAEANLARAQLAGAQADIQMYQQQIDEAVLRAPIDGTIIAGDLSQQGRVAVEAGDVLFEIAPVRELRAELMIPEDQMVGVERGAEGKLALAAAPDERIAFEVERVEPVPRDVQEQENLYVVHARLSRVDPHMRPGMKGLGKVHLGRKPYGWLWTRRIVNWVRMKLWI
jgi:hypothetical protein